MIHTIGTNTEAWTAYCLLPSAYSLAVGFITPGFAIAGLLAASIPIIIHILNRRRYKIVSWAAMDFLLNAMKKNRRRLKFEQWVLLAVRCLVLGLLGLALARPLGCDQASLAGLSGSRAGVHVLVIDNSYSMGYDTGRPTAPTHLAKAKQLAKAQIDRLSRGGESVVVITAGRPAALVGGGKPTYDLDAAKASIDRIEQSAGGTDLLGAMQLALQIGREEEKQPRRSLYLLTDGTKSAWETSHASAVKQAATDLAAIFELTHFHFARSPQANVAAIGLSGAGGLLTTKFPADFRSDVRGFGPNLEAPLQWTVNGQLMPSGGVVKLEPVEKPQTLSAVPIRVGGPQVVTASLAGGDKLPIDDTRHLVAAVASELKVLIVEGERGMTGTGGSGAFLQLALSPPKTDDSRNPTGNLKTDSYVASEAISALELSSRVLGDYGAVIMTDVGQITAAQADRLADYVKSGGTLMWFMGEQVGIDNYNTILAPRKLLPGVLAKRVSVGAGERGAAFDFRPNADSHRLLSIFRGVDRSGLDTAQVFTYLQLMLPDNHTVERVLNYQLAGAKPDKDKPVAGDPAITLHTLGQGRVVFVSTSAGGDGGASVGNEWNTLPSKPAYVPLVHELLAGSVSTGDAWMNRTVGQTLEVPTTIQLAGQPQLLDASKKPLILEPGTVGSNVAFRSEPLNRPGVYTLSAGNRSIPIAVNVPGDEADVRTVDDNAIKSALGGVEVALLGDQLPPETDAASAGNDLGWNVMLLVLMLVGAECFLAMLFGHTRRAVVKE